ncbi:MAG: AAA family ATPase [Acidobacteriota bacterium]|nr:AAA family ATPase [Acidobacteriota bacterium]MDQ5835358.1 AAA family ATPase [Acidobacteriota bacterium]
MNPNPDIFPNAPEAGDGGTDAPASELPPNPFVGLRPFDTSESLLFFGRDEQTTELLQQLDRGRFLAVIGSSGCGKSSLIRAGLMPKLKGGFLVSTPDQWRFATMKPGKSPILNLAAALLEACGEDVKQSPQLVEPLAQRIRLAGAQAITEHLSQRLGARAANVLLLVDQFEEIFRFGFHADEGEARETPGEWKRRRDEAADFVSIMLELSRQDSFPVYVVITMRSDFLSDCDEFYGLPQAINRGLYLVPRLTRRQRMEAVACPIRLYGEEISPGLLDRVLNDMGVGPEQAPKGKDEETDELPVMQHAMMRTWEDWLEESKGKSGVEPGPIDLRHYENVGTIKGALSKDADAALGSLSAEEQEIAVLVFQALTDTDARGRRLRRPARLSELKEIAGLSPDSDTVERIIKRFRSNNRLFIYLSEERLSGDTLVDISHESLIRRWVKLSEWVDAEAASKDQYLRLVGDALLYQRKKTSLLRDPALQLALDWWEERRPNETWARRYHPDFLLAEKYLDDSRREREAEAARTEAAHQQELEQARAVAEQRRVFNRRLSWAVAALIVLLLSASGLAVYAFRARAEAKAATDEIEKTKSKIEEQNVKLVGYVKQLKEEQEKTNRAKEEALAAKQDALDARDAAVAASDEAKKQAQLAVQEKKSALSALTLAHKVQDADKTHREANKQEAAVDIDMARYTYLTARDKYRALNDWDGVAHTYSELGRMLTSREGTSAEGGSFEQSFWEFLLDSDKHDVDPTKPTGRKALLNQMLGNEPPMKEMFPALGITPDQKEGLSYFGQAIHTANSGHSPDFNESAFVWKTVGEFLRDIDDATLQRDSEKSEVKIANFVRKQAAVDSFCRALDHYQRAGKAKGQIAVLTGLGDFFSEPESTYTFDLGNGDTALTVAGCLDAKASGDAKTSDSNTQAFRYYEDALSIYRDFYRDFLRNKKNTPQQVMITRDAFAESLITTGAKYLATDKNDLATKHFEEAVGLYGDPNERKKRAETSRLIASASPPNWPFGVSKERANFIFVVQETYYNRAAQEFHDAQMFKEEADTLGEGGRYFLGWANYFGRDKTLINKGIALAQKALSIYDRLIKEETSPTAVLGIREQQARLLLPMGDSYLNALSDTDQALKLLQQAVEAYASLHDNSGHAQALYYLGLAQEKKRLWDEARKSYDQALALSPRTSLKYNLQAALSRLTPAQFSGDLVGAPISGETPSGKVRFEADGNGGRSLEVLVENVNLPAGTVLEVLVNNVKVGTITLAEGRKSYGLKLETGKGQSVPQVVATTRIVVADQSGKQVVASVPSKPPVIVPQSGQSQKPAP